MYKKTDKVCEIIITPYIEKNVYSIKRVMYIVCLA